MKSSKQFPTSRPCNTFVLAARKMNPLSVVKFELWPAKSQIFLSLTLCAFGSFEGWTWEATEKRQNTFHLIGTLREIKVSSK